MKASVTKISAILTLLLFVNFMFSNTVFIHSHITDDGHTVTHSHPYLPSSHHGHSAQSLALISQLNLIAASADVPNTTPPSCASLQIDAISCNCMVAWPVTHVPARGLRAPPHVA